MGIFHYDFNKEKVIWDISLFNEQENVIVADWEWVNIYRQMFMDMKVDSGATFKDCKNRMMKFFSEHPTVRVDDVMEATKLYLESVNDIRYLQQANYFIKKGTGESRLEQFIEIYNNSTKFNSTIKMM
jgi:hypothetical protein